MRFIIFKFYLPQIKIEKIMPKSDLDVFDSKVLKTSFHKEPFHELPGNVWEIENKGIFQLIQTTFFDTFFHSSILFGSTEKM